MAREVVIELTDMAHGGDAVGREKAGSQAIFVPYGLPGEVARVEIVRDHGNMAVGRLKAVLSASAARTQPPCPYFGRCGGCQWQHAVYPAQLEYKRATICSQLQRIGRVADAEVRPVIGMETPWGYRNNAQFSVSKDGHLGFMAAGSHDVIPVQSCLLLHPLLSDLFETLDMDLPGLRQLTLRAGLRSGEQMLVFEMDGDCAPEVELDLPISCVLLLSDGRSATLVGSPHIREQLAGHTFRVSATSFFQVNTTQAERLVQLVAAAVDDGPQGPVLDAYCGVGTFALAIANPARPVVGVESSADAVLDAEANAAGQPGVRFLHGDVEDLLPELRDRFAQVILDPPRTGVHKRALTALLEAEPEQINYVSCDPATLARDVRLLCGAGYRLLWVQPVDMFPQTFHIESVAVLVRETSR